eukprot:jgi/Mesen1/625/ME000108S10784
MLDFMELIRWKAVPTVLGVTGTATGLCALLAPASTFVYVVKRGSTEKYSCTPYLVTLLSSCIWAYYGSSYVANDRSVLTINTLGLLIQLSYCTIFVRYAATGASRSQVLKFFMAIMVGLASGVFLAETMLSKELKVVFVGVSGDLVSVMACASPVFSLAQMMKTKNVTFFPIALCVMNFLNTLIWMLYGIVQLDTFITLPNLAGMLLSGMQVFVYLLYRRSAVRQEEDTGTPLLKELVISPQDEIFGPAGDKPMSTIRTFKPDIHQSRDHR